MISPAELNRIAAEAEKIIREMGQQLAKYDAKATVLLLSKMQLDLNQPMSFPEDISHKKLDTAAANKRLEEFIELLKNPEKYPLETKVAEAEEMKKILDLHQQKITKLYDDAFSTTESASSN